ncbi:hypothetical protein J5X84_42525 [Streptosporangiaceae bacterium NEAU-GS5]|nr:hypothetical protein [Streptosporangiaceae bacterium NEAU-GS5]
MTSPTVMSGCLPTTRDVLVLVPVVAVGVVVAVASIMSRSGRLLFTSAGVGEGEDCSPCGAGRCCGTGCDAGCDAAGVVCVVVVVVVVEDAGWVWDVS